MYVLLFTVLLFKSNWLSRNDYRGLNMFLDQVIQMFERQPENFITSLMNNDLCNLASSHVVTLVMILVTFLIMLSVIAIRKSSFACQLSFHIINSLHVMNKYVKWVWVSKETSPIIGQGKLLCYRVKNGRRISRNVVSLNTLAHDLINQFSYCNIVFYADNITLF